MIASNVLGLARLYRVRQSRPVSMRDNRPYRAAFQSVLKTQTNLAPDVRADASKTLKTCRPFMFAISLSSRMNASA